MPKRLYLGNLPYTATEQDVREFLAPQTILAVDFIHDRETGRPRGFGFAEVADDVDVEKLIADRNGMEMNGRSITVSPANEKPRSGGGRRDHGGGGGRNGRPPRGRRDEGHGRSRDD